MMHKNAKNSYKNTKNIDKNKQKPEQKMNSYMKKFEF